MKKIILIFIVGIFLVSCSPTKSIIPRAVNTVNSATLKELNLDREDYEMLNTITAEAIISYKERWNGGYEIEGKDDNFSLTCTQSKLGPIYTYSGILKLGYLTNDYGHLNYYEPEQIARGLAIYRAINIVKEYGADAVIEPVISTNIEQIGKEILFKSIVTAKLIKLKTNN